MHHAHVSSESQTKPTTSVSRHSCVDITAIMIKRATGIVNQDDIYRDMERAATDKYKGTHGVGLETVAVQAGLARAEAG